MQKEYKDYIPPEGGREYSLTSTPTGRTKIEDVTSYLQEGETWGAADILSGCEMEFTHSKSGSVHNFTNPNASAARGRAKMTADVEAGDTFTVNGTPVTAYMGTEDAAGSMAGNAWTGKWITFVFDGDTLNFKGGGGLSAADRAKLIPDNIRENVKLFEGTPKEIIGGLVPSDAENSIIATWVKVYDNSNTPKFTTNATEESPVAISQTQISILQDFSAFVVKLPFKDESGYPGRPGSSNIPEGQNDFTAGQKFSVSVNPDHGNNRTSGFTVAIIINKRGTS